jgi:hypothetical protein
MRIDNLVILRNVKKFLLGCVWFRREVVKREIGERECGKREKYEK